MRRFLFRFGFFLILPCVVCVIELYNIQKQQNNSFLISKSQYMTNHAPEIETLILGHSHTLYALCPRYLTGHAYNLAYPRRTIAYDYQLLKKYEFKLQNLKNIIVPYDMFSYHNKKDSHMHLYYDVFGIGTKSVPPPYYDDVIQPHLQERYQQIKDFILHFIKHRTAPVPEHKFIRRYYGWQSVDRTKDVLMTKSRAKSAYAYHVSTTSDSNNNLLFYDSLMKFCEQNACHLYLVTTPKYKYYTDLIELQTWNKAQNELDSLINEHPKVDIHYLDLLTDNRFTYEDYMDVNHLNVQGSKKISKIVNEFMRQTSTSQK